MAQLVEFKPPHNLILIKCKKLDSISQPLSGEVQVQWTWLRPVPPRPRMVKKLIQPCGI